MQHQFGSPTVLAATPQQHRFDDQMMPPVYVTPEQNQLIHRKELRMQQLNAEKKLRGAEHCILDVQDECIPGFQNQ